MMRGDTAFEEKRIECEFTLVFGKVANLALSDLRSTYEYVFRQAYFAGKAAGKREQSSVAVATNAEPQKGPTQ